MTALLILLAALLLPSGAAFAFSFEPIIRDFTPSGPGTVQNFRLHNDGDENIAVRIRIFTRDMDEEGKEELLPAEGLFLIYPSQVVLRPRTVQTLKVQWRGPANVDTEQCFRILVEQMAVNFEESSAAKSHIRIMFRYLGALYVVPPRAGHEVILESSRPADNGNGLELVFYNRGNSHVILGDMTISVKRKDTAEALLVFSPEDLPEINGQNILPLRRRRFFLPLPETHLRDDTLVSFDFDPIR
jgi:fimbrial chaperone protein